MESRLCGPAALPERRTPRRKRSLQASTSLLASLVGLVGAVNLESLRLAAEMPRIGFKLPLVGARGTVIRQQVQRMVWSSYYSSELQRPGTSENSV